MSNDLTIEREWEFKGYHCVVIYIDMCLPSDFKSTLLEGGHRCGYVGVPKGHIAYDCNYEDLEILIHGGLTFDGRARDKKEDEARGFKKGFQYYGFDCGHAGDTLAKWTADEVVKEVKRLAINLRSMKKAQTLTNTIREFLTSTTVDEFKKRRQKNGETTTSIDIKYLNPIDNLIKDLERQIKLGDE